MATRVCKFGEDCIIKRPQPLTSDYFAKMGKKDGEQLWDSKCKACKKSIKERRAAGEDLPRIIPETENGVIVRKCKGPLCNGKRLTLDCFNKINSGSGAFTSRDLLKSIKIEDDTVTIGDKIRKVQWDDAVHHNLEGVIASIEPNYKGRIMLTDKQTFENPNRKIIRTNFNYQDMCRECSKIKKRKKDDKGV